MLVPPGIDVKGGRVRLRVLACLPRVTVPPAGIDLGSVRLVQLPFAEWLALEGQSRSAVYNNLEGKYSKRPPSFAESWIEADPALLAARDRAHTAALTRQAAPGLDVLVAALHWYTGIAPIHPRRSVIYFDTERTDDGVPRAYGESEKEYATEHHEPLIVLRDRDAAPLDSMLAFAQRTMPAWTTDAYQHAMQSLALSSTPGLGWPARLLLLVGAFEALLVSDRKSGLQQAFSERFAALAAPGPGQLPEWTAWVGLAYRLRSDLVHGRPTAPTLAKLSAPPGEYVARLERAGVVALCRLLDDVPLVRQWQVEAAPC
jgi:hypothetical protein